MCNFIFDNSFIFSFTTNIIPFKLFRYEITKILISNIHFWISFVKDNTINKTDQLVYNKIINQHLKTLIILCLHLFSVPNKISKKSMNKYLCFSAG